jgi:hypothetical protein
MKLRHVIRHAAGIAALIAVGIGSTSCGEVARTGRAPVTLIIDELLAANGDDDTNFTSFLLSDVSTNVEADINGQQVLVPTIFNDPGRAKFRLALKNPGSVGQLTPSTLNEVTLSRYRVVYRRTDGRNTPGVDVPYMLEGGFTGTVPASGTLTASFDLVRHSQKLEPPLRNLVGLGGAMFISTIAEVTFWGRDQAGNQVEAFGTINITFGDFGDKK